MIYNSQVIEKDIKKSPHDSYPSARQGDQKQQHQFNSKNSFTSNSSISGGKEKENGSSV